MSDNRKSTRVPTQLRCWCEGDNVTLYARITNLSEGGLFLRTSTPLSPGARALVRLGPAEDPEVQASATVVWLREDEDRANPPGMGLRFENIDAETLGRLRRIISQQQNPVKASWAG
ncbi:TIGR02266 family protein [Myxococcus sp. K15C18031901]|uniref:TIGR02266 family protein n=1 Tax=Myxococcus dinghuensis TaxID=2906761 RepID=UPI0020A82937|nr:TIGR02266 family protein [Myxococcus dinghuensis]MCP3099380.1 TIGR02266 family protein [Myxococcus dinghuensis]